MFFGAYLGVTGLLFLIGLVALGATTDSAATVATARRWRRAYFLLTFAIAGLCLLAFVTLSVVTGLMTFGAATTWRYPGDYLAAGPAGWALLSISVVGVAAPLWALLWLRRDRRSQPPAPHNV